MGLTIAQKIIKAHLVDDGSEAPKLTVEGIPEAGSDEICEKYVDDVIDVIRKKGHII